MITEKREVDFSRYKSIGFEPKFGTLSELLDFFRTEYDWHIFAQMTLTTPVKKMVKPVYEWVSTMYDLRGHVWLLETDDDKFLYSYKEATEVPYGIFVYDNYEECIEAACIWLCKQIMFDTRFDKDR